MNSPRILIIKMSSMGDLFHALPTVHNLKIELKAVIDWVTHIEYMKLVECFTDVNRVIPFYRNAFFYNLKPFLKDLRLNEYDYIIDLQGLLKSAMVARLAMGEIVIGPSFHREGAGLFYSAVAGSRYKNRHAIDENMDVIKHLGLNLIDPKFPVSFPNVSFKKKNPGIAIFPISRWKTKNWPKEYFLKLARLLQNETNGSLFLFGGADNVEICNDIERGTDGDVVNMAGKTTLVEMGGMLKEMDLLIANDSGPVHMAVATETPVLVIFGPTDPGRTGPYGSIKSIAKASLPCQPCFSKTCARADIRCLYEIKPERVKEMAIDMLAYHA